MTETIQMPFWFGMLLMFLAMPMVGLIGALIGSAMSDMVDKMLDKPDGSE